ncbi:MAG: ShlB/FhaC/HecB family hemolysin secretion/activation protein [Phycisphaerales bacterium]|jgi:hemolysin activation/secretion protein
MNNVTRMVCLTLAFAFLLACVGCDAQNAKQPSRPTDAKTKAQLRRDEKIRKDAAAKAKREAAAKAKREASEKAKREAAAKAHARRLKKARDAEQLKAKREAAAKAKREAAAKAKAKRDEEAKLLKLNEEAQKQANVEMAKAASEKKVRLAELEARAKKQDEKLMAELKVEQTKLKRQLEQNKAKLKAQYETAKAQAKKNKAKLDAEYKMYQQATAKLEAAHKMALAGLEKKADSQAKQIKRDKSMVKAELAKSEKTSQMKAERASLKRKLDQDKARLKAEYERAVAAAKKDKTKTDADKKAYQQKIAKIELDYKEALAKLKIKANTQAAQIKQAKRQNTMELTRLNNAAKKQAAGIKSEKASLKRGYDQNKTKLAAEYKQAKVKAKKDKAKLKAEEGIYKQKVAQLDAEYKKALKQLQAKADAQASKNAQAKRENKAKLAELNANSKQQAKEIKAEEAKLKDQLKQDKKVAKLYGIEKLAYDYQESISRLEAEYKESLGKIGDKEKARAEMIAKARKDSEAKLKELDAKAKEQAKEVKAEKAKLELKLKQDKKEEEKKYGLSKLAAEYMKDLTVLEDGYLAELAKATEKSDAQKTEYAAQKKQIEEDYEKEIAKINVGLRLKQQAARIAKMKLPEDNTPRMNVKELRISGNTLVSTSELLKDIPLIYNASDKPMEEAESAALYDLRVLQQIIVEPGETREVSMRTIQGFTQYLLSAYQAENQAGIYVYVPADAITPDRQLKDEILPVNILEASVSSSATAYFNPENEKVEEGYLSSSAIEEWSPAKIGETPDQKELDDFVNLLNKNPDRYVSAVVSRGTEPNSLAVGYNIYEANPWHWFMQVDNSGTKGRQWHPRIGVINTNLLGFDDTFTAMYQAPWDKTLTDNYALYSSYDFPLLGPGLRLNVYGGYSEFDINPSAGLFNFLGKGSFFGGILRYNLYQEDGWFFDVKGSMEQTISKVTPTLFPTFLGSQVRFWLWGVGADLYRTDDMSQTSLSFDRYSSLCGGSDRNDFSLARTNSDTDFTFYTASASHSQFLDTNRIGRLTGTFSWTGAEDRLVPAKMTSFGGMYTVRGYDEYELVADGGIMASAQYEFDLVKYDEVQSAGKSEAEKEEQRERGDLYLKKLAPLVFFDYGRTKITKPIATDRRHEEIFSIGGGALLELGDNFSGAVYYGYPLEPTNNTRTGKGRVNVSFMIRW